MRSVLVIFILLGMVSCTTTRNNKVLTVQDAQLIGAWKQDAYVGNSGGAGNNYTIKIPANKAKTLKFDIHGNITGDLFLKNTKYIITRNTQVGTYYGSFVVLMNNYSTAYLYHYSISDKQLRLSRDPSDCDEGCSDIFVKID